MERGGASYYYHFDGLGSVTALTGSSGSVAESYTYDVFGNPTIKDADGNVIAETAIGNRYLFTGRSYDEETGLYYYRARYYSPGIGRFLQRDPVGYTDKPNLYSYVRNNPINYLDPWGAKPGDKYSSAEEAASEALNDYDDTSIREDAEYMGWGYQNKDGTYSYTPAQKGSAHQSNPPQKPPNAKFYYHTHGAESGPAYDDENFSPADKNYGDGHGVDAYLEPPSGKQKKYDHSNKKVTDDISPLLPKGKEKGKGK